MSWTIDAVQEGAVAPEAVFALYADPATWSLWGHNATWARADAPLAQGGIVKVRAGYGTVYRCVIRRFEPGRALELVVKPAFLTIINIYEVEPTASGGSRVRHAFEVSGPIAGVARMGLARAYQKQLVEEIAAVIRMAGDPGSVAPGRVVPPVSSPERAWHRIGKAVRGGREDQR